jgi:hypothetical protein
MTLDSVIVKIVDLLLILQLPNAQISKLLLKNGLPPLLGKRSTDTF